MRAPPPSSAMSSFHAPVDAYPELARGDIGRYVLRCLLREPRHLKWMLAGTLCESLFGLTGPWLSSRIIDDVLPAQASGSLALAASLVVCSACFGAWAAWLRERVLIALSSRTEADCLARVLECFSGMPFARARAFDFGEVQESMAAAGATVTTLVPLVVGLTTQSLSVLLILACLVYVSATLAIGVLCWALLMVALGLAIARLEARRVRAVLDASSRLQQHLHVLLRGVATLRISGATDRFLGLWNRQLVRETNARIAQEDAAAWQGVVSQGFPQLAWLAATAGLAYAVMRDGASLGQMMLGTMLVGNVMGRLEDLARSAASFYKLRPQLERVANLLDPNDSRAVERRTSDEAVRSSRERTLELELDHVWFRYGAEERFILKDVCRRFPAGKVTEVRAASGAGKTTMLRLLAGLLEPERGSVFVLGKRAHRARHLITYLPQRSTLLEASIATNLRVLSGRPLAECLEVAAHTGLSKIIATMPIGVDTPVSLGGGNLSSGQGQLLLLTAAFAGGRPVVLLDEPTSQLDAATERSIDWEALVGRRTVIVVRHD